MMKQQQHKWLFSSSKRKANQKRSRRSGWFSIFLTVAAVGLGLWCAHSLAELVHVQRVLKQTLRGRDTKSVTEQWQAVKKKLEGGHEELAELKQRHQALKSELEIAEATLLKEKENCKFELQNLEMEWKGKVQLLKQEKLYSKEEKLLELHDEMKRIEERHAEKLAPLRRSENALLSEVESLVRKHVAVERERVLGRILEKTSESYLNAFFDRLRKGSYKGVYVQTRENEKRSRMKSGNKNNANRDGDGSGGPGGSVMMSITEEHESVLPEKIDPFGNEHFPHGGYWPTCAVVGSSGLLLKYEHGNAIDQHDAVFRFDEAPTHHRFEKHVGSKTTVRIVSDAKHMEAREYARSHTREMVLQHIDSQETLDNFTAYSLAKSQGAFNLHRLAPDFKKFIGRFFIGVEIPHGFYGVLLAMQKCHKVYVYGFTHSLNKNFIKRSYHNDNDHFSSSKSAVGSSLSASASSSSYGAGAGAGAGASGVDLDELNMVLISELSNRVRHKKTGDKVVEIVEPCQSMQEAFGGLYCSNTNRDGGKEQWNRGRGMSYSVVRLSSGGDCLPHVPYPVPREGFCYLRRERSVATSSSSSSSSSSAAAAAAVDERSQVYMKDMKSANCFAKCNTNETCPGGFEAPPCEPANTQAECVQ